MGLVFGILNFLGVIIGWISTPIYALFATREKKPFPPEIQPEILNRSATFLAKQIRTKQLTSFQVVNAFVERCKQVNDRINAIIEDRFEAALQEAKNIDEIIQRDEYTVQELESRTPLLGVPITVKESCMVKGLSYTSAAKLRQGIKASKDGDVVAYLRKAGAIPIAVTNIPELTCAFETDNDTFGCTANPYDPNRTAGGTSGGEGALIASAGSVLGVGSDFAGSIRVVCLYNGIFGHKPSSGIVSNEGHLPNHPAERFQRILALGPMCRYAEDLKLTMQIISGDNAHKLKLDQTVNLKKLRIHYIFDEGLLSFSKMSIDSSFNEVIQQAIKHFETTHQCFTQKIDLPELKDASEICISEPLEVKDLKKVLLLKKPQDESALCVEVLKALVRRASYSPSVLAMRCIVEILLRILPKSERVKYTKAKETLISRLKEILQNDGVLFFPTFCTLAHYRKQSPWILAGFWYAMIVNILGFPATHVPMGLNNKGIPVGFQVIAAPNQDRLCLAVAEELEKVFGGWVPPS